MFYCNKKYNDKNSLHFCVSNFKRVFLDKWFFALLK